MRRWHGSHHAGGRCRRCEATGPAELERRKKGLALYFFYSDPDNRNAYYLEKAR
ncbi:hypothetical protein ACFWMU_04305 [Streptomyces sp. NPDC058357]|uniref:hypothetical protein n=1 Tax=unclassified Streptomyces TaxID=2593676 RepID=UPI00364D470A